MNNLISFHYDGPITIDHRITLRTLSSTLTHLQSAIDRAAIDLRRGSLAKHARLAAADYPLTEFIVGEPRDGGYILDLVNSGPLKIVDRMNAAIARAFREAEAEVLPITESLVAQAERRAFAVSQGAQQPMQMSLAEHLGDGVEASRRYADRAINREIDQVLAQLRIERYAGSTLEIQFSGSETSPVYKFDVPMARKFHSVVAARLLGAPLALEVTIRALDAGGGQSKAVGKATHVDSGKTFTLHFRSPEDFNSVVPYMRAKDRPQVRIVACPVLEYGVFDWKAGDMFFIGIQSR